MSIDPDAPSTSRPRVIIESPFAGDRKRNGAYLHLAVLHSLSLGESPYASHAFFPQFLNDDDSDERALGITAGFAWHHAASMVAVYGDFGVSRGMSEGIAWAAQWGIPRQSRWILDQDNRRIMIQGFDHYKTALAPLVFS